MKDRIIEIVELGQPQSFIQRENAPITELIKTDLLIEELNEQLRLYNVVGRIEQFYCTCSRAKGLDHDEEGTPCGDCIFYLTCKHESRDKQICVHFDDQP